MKHVCAPTLAGARTSRCFTHLPSPSCAPCHSHPVLQKLVRKADYSPGGFEGAYLCVRAYGDQPIEFSLQAVLTPCPASFGDAGEALQCSSPLGDAPGGERRYSECTAAGECVCTGAYAKPVASVFPGGVGWKRSKQAGCTLPRPVCPAPPHATCAAQPFPDASASPSLPPQAWALRTAARRW